ncbi:hypothetical protein [Pedobacter frigiditerrae]|uniref:hypothetical protein n=1 Tax=Pedobacter frigiditerrae TaxID=2530452 RepID=UPI0029308CF8|nr:hypothetical protein [Pedobacter frigiditerrae]
MSIYLEFPSIDEYPFYTNPIDKVQETLVEEKELNEIKEEMSLLQNYLFLRLV